MTESLALYRFDALADAALVHAVSTRLGGGSLLPTAGLNLGHTVGDDPQAVAGNHALLAAALGIPSGQIVSAHQVHGNQIAIVEQSDAGRVISETDGLITETSGLYLMLRYADCVPVLLYDPIRQAVGLAHAGWQGTLARVAARTAQAMVSDLGCRVEDLRAAIGPSIGPCCYEVGPEVVTATVAAFPDAPGLIKRRQANGHAHLDLWAANVRQLEQVGIDLIETARLCTACRPDLFFSHRAEQGRTGRFAVILGLRPDRI